MAKEVTPGGTRALMLGSGFFPPERKIVPLGTTPPEPEWVTLDANPACKPDIVFDLSLTEYGDHGRIPSPDSLIPFSDAYFHEIHAYQVLEHFGQQGNYKGFFSTMRELWRLLVPGGMLYGDTPALHSPWLWGDPGHTRVITLGTLGFLTRRHYEELGKTTSTDYRQYVDPCWWLILHAANEGERFGFVLRKDK